MIALFRKPNAILFDSLADINLSNVSDSYRFKILLLL